MKTIVFYLAFIIAAVLLWQISKIIIFDFNRLTEWGFGYLLGKVILFLVFIGLAFFMRKRKAETSNQTD
ncbi:hypothetical protein MKO06_13105 [Gramella sp. GC03-9]|uniref:Uncharacterized protein n=1 Tax=Christiangramia oceanisediminis TaxID=2920386 RepID=A0A9X2KYU7_9FLAO|nr:hypothetical protein [Gramella oceanisediminis]MCP9200852.1 hypothetical protein [Gramella oceanisediminis]